MSLINDALQQARRSAPQAQPVPLQPLQPVPTQPASFPIWFWLVLVLLAAGALCVGGWAWTHRSHRQSSTPPLAVANPQAPAPILASRPPAAVAPIAPVAKPAPAIVSAPPAIRPAVQPAAPAPAPAATVPVVRPATTATTAATAAIPAPAPIVAKKPASTPPSADPVPMNPPGAPKLQGIFFSPSSPSAIVDGRSVRVGSQVGEYRVKAISKTTLTLTGSDLRDIQVSMGN